MSAMRGNVSIEKHHSGTYYHYYFLGWYNYITSASASTQTRIELREPATNMDSCSWQPLPQSELVMGFFESFWNGRYLTVERVICSFFLCKEKEHPNSQIYRSRICYDDWLFSCVLTYKANFYFTFRQFSKKSWPTLLSMEMVVGEHISMWIWILGSGWAWQCGEYLVKFVYCTMCIHGCSLIFIESSWFPTVRFYAVKYALWSS